MPSTSTTSVPPSATAIITALHTAGVATHFDSEEECVFAYPSHVPPDRALDGPHILIDWHTVAPSRPSGDRGLYTATLWYPEEGDPDTFQVGPRIFQSSAGGTLAEESARCGRAVGEWLNRPGHTAGTVLLAALAEYGIDIESGLLTVAYGTHSDGLGVPIAFTGWAHGRLTLADRAGSLRHMPSTHTGWSIILHDEHGEPVGGPVHITGDGTTVVDCVADSAEAAAVVAEWLTTPVSRHCDCYSQDRHGQRHDAECHRYARPSTAGSST
ncbi:hypothetical protein [Streptomyces sp. NPDC097619]|uniref:hypothetical protein n=1 Tax=Streptomyces sp. NPDC097619 TaxID=3157228 RepID=UPI00332326EA